VVFGDSLVGQTTDGELNLAFSPDPEVFAEFGAPIERWLDEATLVGQGDAQAVVVALGTNDVGGGLDQQDLDEVVTMLDRLAPIGCTRWATVTTHGDNPNWPGEAAEFNDFLAQQDEARPELELIPWAEELDQHPEYQDTDGVHHTPEGQSAFAQALADSVDDC
jgi:lysophospholipase L1-like esterase